MAAVPDTAITDEPLRLGELVLESRLIVGTGKYPSLESMREALAASGTQMVTVAIRRAELDITTPSFMEYIDPARYHLLPNTAGAYSAAAAIQLAELAREASGTNRIKLEVLGDERTLLPDPVGTLEATQHLVKDGFTVYVYTTDDPIMARRLEDAGAAVVMPAGAPIGSGQGILNRNNLRIILENRRVPIIVDAGVGTASDVTVAFELGVDAVLLNTGIAAAKDPVRMAQAMRHAALAGRQAYLAGRMPKRLYAKASSPVLDF